MLIQLEDKWRLIAQRPNKDGRIHPARIESLTKQGKCKTIKKAGGTTFDSNVKAYLLK